MATKKKLLEAAAGSAGGGAGLNVEEVFSTYLYEGTGSEQTIKNEINIGQGYGSGSVELNGVDQSLYVSHDNVFDLGTSSFTIEFFVNADTYSGDSFAVGLISGYSGYLTGIYIATSIVYGYYQWGAVNQTPLISSTILDAKKWYHIALVRNGSNFSLYVDGTAVATQTDGSAIYDASQIFTIGEYITAAGNKLDGCISNVRFSDTARYTANFTPPTANFTSDSNTILLTCVGEDKTDLSSNALTVLERGSSIQTSSFGPHDADEAGEGGLVWIKSRTDTSYNQLQDTERGTSQRRWTNTTDADSSVTTAITSFNSNGFTLGTNSTSNGSGKELASWTFRKAPKFFDVVTYTGDGTAGRTVSHNLGTTVGCIIIKRTDVADNWAVYHRGVDATSPEDYYLSLDRTNARADNIAYFYDTAPTSTEFTVGGNGDVNANGSTYVAYLFAHNDDDGEFGPDGDADIIKCGSYTGNGSTDGTEVDLGFEPQWVMIKAVSTSDGWNMYDNMRGLVSEGADALLYANQSAAENPFGGTYQDISPLANGFKLNSTSGRVNSSGYNYIYIAIRRGPMAVPESADEVFTPVLTTSSGDFTAEAGFPVDLNWYGRRSANDGGFTWDRLRGANYLRTNSTGAETAYSAASFDSNTAFYLDGLAGDYSDFMTYNWKRAPNFFDVVAYTGDGVAGRTVSHNLGVAPEMIWVKSRSNAQNWYVYHKDVGAGSYLTLQTVNAPQADTYNWIWNSTAPTNTEFTVSTFSGQNTYTYIAYLFASLDGVSKVGSYTGNGSTQTIDCGFSSGAKFVLIKRTDSTGDWYVWDTERGIVAANDPHLSLNSTAAEVTTDDSIDPVSSGFAVNQVAATNINVSSASYIFYAIA